MSRRAIEPALEWLRNNPTPRLKQEGDSAEAIAARAAERKKLFQRHSLPRGRKPI